MNRLRQLCRFPNGYTVSAPPSLEEVMARSNVRSPQTMQADESLEPGPESAAVVRRAGPEAFY